MESNPEIIITASAKSIEEVEGALLQFRRKIPAQYRIIARETLAEIQDASFNHSLYFEELKTVYTGRILLTCVEIDSTQSFLRDYGISSPGIVFISDSQIKGCGRGSNSWVSPKGGLFFSFNCSCRESENLPFIQYIICLAVIEAIIWNVSSTLLQYGISESFTEDFRIKWPNDIYFKSIKIGGILCYSSYSDGIYYVTNGVGLNLDNMAPTICINSILNSIVLEHRGEKYYPSGDKKIDSVEKIGRERLLAKILEYFEGYYKVFTCEGFHVLENLYLYHWLHSGEKITFKESDAQTPISMTIQGLTSTGYLLAVSERGDRYELCPDGNSFDFFSGLIYRKL